MAGISAKDVKALRDQTGAGMMDCKKALTDAEGNVEQALDLLRERGLSKAGKRAGRETSEGAVAVSSEGGAGTIVVGSRVNGPLTSAQVVQMRADHDILISKLRVGALQQTNHIRSGRFFLPNSHPEGEGVCGFRCACLLHPVLRNIHGLGDFPGGRLVDGA